jgi:hypothetical protein
MLEKRHQYFAIRLEIKLKDRIKELILNLISSISSTEIIFAIVTFILIYFTKIDIINRIAKFINN